MSLDAPATGWLPGCQRRNPLRRLQRTVQTLRVPRSSQATGKLRAHTACDERTAAPQPRQEAFFLHEMGTRAAKRWLLKPDRYIQVPRSLGDDCWNPAASRGPAYSRPQPCRSPRRAAAPPELGRAARAEPASPGGAASPPLPMSPSLYDPLPAPAPLLPAAAARPCLPGDGAQSRGPSPAIPGPGPATPLSQGASLKSGSDRAPHPQSRARASASGASCGATERESPKRSRFGQSETEGRETLCHGPREIAAPANGKGAEAGLGVRRCRPLKGAGTLAPPSAARGRRANGSAPGR